MGLLQSVTDGFSLGGIFLLVALGFAIIFGFMKVINLAHGELIMIGAYTTYVITSVLNLPFFIALIGSFIVTAIVGAIIEILVIKKLYSRTFETLLATLGISIVLQQIIVLIFGNGNKSVDTPISGALSFANSLTIPYFRILIVVIALGIFGGLLFLYFKTKFGIKLQSVSKNREISEVLGINSSRIDTLTFALGSGIAGIAGAMLAPIRIVSPLMGTEYLTDAFMAVVLGGVGSLMGTAAGAVLIAEVTQLLSFVGTEVIASIVVFIIVILIIRFKPEGLFKIEKR